MNGTNKLRYGTSRVDARLLLAMLDHISTHGGVAAPELGKILSLSRATVIRIPGETPQQPHNKPDSGANLKLTGQSKITIMRTFDTLPTEVGRLREKVRCAHSRTRRLSRTVSWPHLFIP